MPTSTHVLLVHLPEDEAVRIASVLARQDWSVCAIASADGLATFRETHGCDLVVAEACALTDTLIALKAIPGSVPVVVVCRPERRAALLADLPDEVFACVGFDEIPYLEGVIRRALDWGLATARHRIADENLQRLRKAVDSSSEVIFLTDPQGVLQYVNPEFSRLYGYSWDEVVGQTTPRILKGGTLPREVYEQFWARLLAGHEVRGELINRRKDGRLVTIEGSANAVMDERGQLLGFLAVQRDITERKLAEQARLETERRLRLSDEILARVPSLVLVADETGRVTFVSPSVRTILGYRPEDLLGDLWWTRTRLDLAEGLAEKDRTAGLAAGREAVDDVLYERAVIGADGRTRWIRFHNARGPGNTLIGVGQDVTEHFRLEEQFRQAQKMEAVGRLAGGIAHDFNNLLTTVLGYADLALSQLTERDPLKVPIEEIRHSGERAAALTSRLLAFSRKQVLQPRVLDLNAVVAGMVPMLRRMIGEDVELVTSPRPGSVSVMADPSQLEQVVMNLAVNARDAMPRGGRLTIDISDDHAPEMARADRGASNPGPWVALKVSDTGIGMDAETLSHMFEPFFTTKEPGKGTGLGLSTVYGIVTQSGGYVTVASEAGRGSTFTVHLPKSQSAPADLEPPAGRAVAPCGSETILIAEDEDAVRDLVRTILEHHGYRVLQASGGHEALALCERYGDEIHLLVSDVVMPLMSGPELASRLVDSRPAIKTLFLSGYTDEAVNALGVLEGSNFIQKPFKPFDLAIRVRDILDGPAH